MSVYDIIVKFQIFEICEIYINIIHKRSNRRFLFLFFCTINIRIVYNIYYLFNRNIIFLRTVILQYVRARIKNVK